MADWHVVECKSSIVKSLEGGTLDGFQVERIHSDALDDMRDETREACVTYKVSIANMVGHCAVVAIPCSFERDRQDTVQVGFTIVSQGWSSYLSHAKKAEFVDALLSKMRSPLRERLTRDLPTQSPDTEPDAEQ